MFDILGILAFLAIIVSFIASILSLFNRRMNQKLWIIILISSAVLFMGSYWLDSVFDKETPIKIDYSGVKLDPTPTPKPTPSPTPSPTASAKVSDAPRSTPKSVSKPAEPIKTEEPSYVPSETNIPENTDNTNTQNDPTLPSQEPNVSKEEEQ